MSSSENLVQRISSSTKEEKRLIVQERDHSSVPIWWKLFQILFYLTVFIGGISTSISLGNITTYFRYGCVLHANLTIKGVDDIVDVDSVGRELEAYSKSVSFDNVYVTNWGNMNDCLFCTFSPAAQAAFAFLWGALFLQCGKGGKNSQSETKGWQIVAPALFFASPLLILSIFSLSMLTSGLSNFCNNILRNSAEFETNLTSCGEVFSLRFPWNESGSINLYTNYVIAQTGIVLVFVGWLMAVVLLVIRCLTHVDFVVTEITTKTVRPRPTIEMIPHGSGTRKRLKDKDSGSNSSDSNYSDEDYANENVKYGEKQFGKTAKPLLSPTSKRGLFKRAK